MKTIRTPFASVAKAFALVAMATIATTFTACQSSDEGVAGAIPLVLGEVSVDAPHTTNGITRGGTRASITENTSGYTGIRKSRFVASDAVTLTLDDSGNGGSSKTVTATLDADGSWSLGSTPVYIQPGKTVITAAYTATEQSVGIEKDDLVAATTDCTLAGSVLSLSMNHAAGMIDITPASGTPAIISITLNTAATPTVKEDEETTTGGTTVTTPHYRALATAASTITSLTTVIGGVTYEATLGTPITVVANKRYPIALTFKNSTLTATVGAPEGWTDGGEIENTTPPAGYTRFIGTPEDLAQFAKDVDDQVPGAQGAIVYQTADIDISQLKTAAQANADAGVTTYTYTATANDWVPIGKREFRGKYNGNGHTISNLKFTTYPTTFIGLFGRITSASLTGIHLRNFQALDNAQSCLYMGTLAAACGGTAGNIITLCSATGTIKGKCDRMGGLIGEVQYAHITRCTARVDLENQKPGNAFYVGGLVGFYYDPGAEAVAGCSVVSNITGIASARGFVGDSNIVPFGCYCGGTMAQTDKPVFDCPVTSCYSGMTATAGFGVSSKTYTACAYTGANAGTGVTTGVTFNAAPANIYGILTAGDASSPTPIKTLHWSATDGYTLTVVTKTWKASKIWKDNSGAAPTLDLTYEGE